MSVHLTRCNFLHNHISNARSHSSLALRIIQHRLPIRLYSRSETPLTPVSRLIQYSRTSTLVSMELLFCQLQCDGVFHQSMRRSSSSSIPGNEHTCLVNWWVSNIYFSSKHCRNFRLGYIDL